MSITTIYGTETCDDDFVNQLKDASLDSIFESAPKTAAELFVYIAKRMDLVMDERYFPNMSALCQDLHGRNPLFYRFLRNEIGHERDLTERAGLLLYNL